jgi:hypothetical protein
MQAIMDATIVQLGKATLTTADAIVFAGTGAITIGSIAVIESVMAENIDTQLQNSGAQGSNRANLSKAIAAGICRQIISNGTGSTIITGSPIIPIPVPGVGVGTGIIS